MIRQPICDILQVNLIMITMPSETFTLLMVITKCQNVCHVCTSVRVVIRVLGGECVIC